ncbi:4-hydroxy-4-methyl-2-oxoglutarate aldolase, partial [Neolecta irregularis DAH-3]
MFRMRLSKWDIETQVFQQINRKFNADVRGLLPRITPGHNKCTKIHGPAFTVKSVPIDDTTSPKIEGHWIDKVRPGSVIVISQPEPHFVAMVGGILAARAKYLGAKGIIIDGYFRDVEEIENMEIP